MKTIGKFLKDARLRKRYSLVRLEKEIKIKKEFLESLEKETWESLPEFPVVRGFVKAIAGFLGISQREAVALLRRDYPPKPITVVPKPDISSRLVFGPRLTFFLGILLVLILVLGYLSYQYLKFTRPPSLEIFEPEENQIVKGDTVLVSGKASTDAVIEVNNQPVLIDQDGRFEVEIRIFEGTEEVFVSATSRSGKETVIRRKIKPELNQ